MIMVHLKKGEIHQTGESRMSNVTTMENTNAMPQNVHSRKMTMSTLLKHQAVRVCKNSTLLLAHNDSSGQHDVWYLDFGASNHMCGRKETSVELKEGVCENVSLGDSSKLAVEGRRKVRIQKMARKNSFMMFITSHV